MYEEIKRLAIGPGTEATLARIQPLASEYAQPLEELYHRWGEDPAVAWRWSFDMHLRLVGLRFSDDRWYIAQVQGQPVSAMVLCRSRLCPQLGSIHRAYTAEPYRRRGLASHLLDSAISDFESSGGEALIVTTESFNNVSQLYRKTGFQKINHSGRGYGEVFWRIKNEEEPVAFLDRLLASENALVLRPSDRSDVPQLLALFNAPDQRLLRHYALQILGDMNITAEELFPAFEQQEGDVAVLTGLTASNGALVGWGSIMPHVYPWPNPYYQQHQLLVDCYLAQSHLDSAFLLLQEMIQHLPPSTTAEQLIAYVPLDDSPLPTAYHDIGFRRVGVLPRAYAQPRGHTTDVGIYILDL